MKLWQYEGKRVRFVLKSGQIFEGVAYDYTSALDNEPHGACISVGTTELLEAEIERIELL